MSRLLFLGMVILLFFACAEEKKTPAAVKINQSMENTTPNPLDSSQQLVVVVSPHDTSVIASLRRYERKEAAWQQIGEEHAVSLGRTGLAWGKGKHQTTITKGYQKKEGDGKSPAGIFSFGVAFGYAKEIADLKMPYVPISASIQCIEDSASKYYNQIVDNQKIIKDWNTADFMQRKDDLYEFGVFVNHNSAAESEGGSCIFLHLWRGYGKPTAGCTAMEKENMFILLKWLDPAKTPRLVQFVEKDYARFEKRYDLPKWTKE